MDGGGRTVRRAEVVRFAICNELFEGWAFERVCRFIKAAGYDGVEVAPFTFGVPVTDITAAERRAAREQAADAGVEIIGLHWLLAKTTGFHLTSPDADVRRRTGAYLVDLAHFCRDLGGSIMVFGSPQQRSLQPGVTHAQAVTFASDTFGRAMSGVADAGVTICMEPLSAAETDFVNTCESAVELIEAVAHPNFVLHLDVKAMSSEPTPIPDLIWRFGPQTGHFHANDPNRGGPGSGAVDFVPIFQALADVGYRRWVSVEVFDFTPGPEAIATKSIEYLRTTAKPRT